MTSFPLRISSTPDSIGDVDADWFTACITQGGILPEFVADLDVKLNGEIARLREAGDVTGKHLEIVTILSPRGIRARRLLLVGLGPTEKLTRSVIHDAFAAAPAYRTG